MAQNDKYKDYGQDTFTRSQILAIRERMYKEEKQKEKELKKEIN